MIAATNQIERQFAELCDLHRDVLLSVLRLVTSQTPTLETGKDVPDTLSAIKGKEFISAGEAAELFGCSAQHFRNLVQRAIDGKATEPVTFRDLDGVITFPLSELIEWRKSRKQRQSRPRGKIKHT